ncbi:MAG TPA: hypothetical protein VLG91_03455 [Streptomyces sp.]|nr:hypothetical protein [Streptomyces sp.]
MSTSTDAILAYGIDLGEVDWEELGYVHTDDCLACEGNGCGECFGDENEWLTARLRAEGIKGVGLTRYCSLSNPMWLLTSRGIGAHRGDVVFLDKAHLNVPAAETLAIGEAARVLGIAADVEPAWMLVSFWDQ